MNFLYELLRAMNHWYCRVTQNAKQAITLNSASSKFRNLHNRSNNSNLPFWRDNCWRAVTEMELHILKLQNFVAMPQTDINEAFLFVTPRSRILILLLHERHTLLPKSSVFDSFWKITILVPLGGRLTVLGHNLEKYESSEKLSAGRQHEKS